MTKRKELWVCDPTRECMWDSSKGKTMHKVPRHRTVTEEDLANHTSPCSVFILRVCRMNWSKTDSAIFKQKFSYETGPPQGCQQSTGGREGWLPESMQRVLAIPRATRSEQAPCTGVADLWKEIVAISVPVNFPESPGGESLDEDLSRSGWSSTSLWRVVLLFIRVSVTTTEMTLEWRSLDSSDPP